MVIHPDSNGEDASPLVEMNACHGPNDGKFCSGGGGSDEAPVTYVSDAEWQPKHADSAAFYSRPEHRIYAREKYRGNEPLMAHEQGHALFDRIQPPEWAQVLDADPAALTEFHQTSTAKSYTKFRGADASNLYSFDWIEAAADLHMEYKMGRLKDKPALTRVIKQLLGESADRRRKGIL